MNEVNVFYITGKKNLIFRKEGECFISFDPLALEFVKINLIGSEILYLISKKYEFSDILQYFVDKYNVDKKTIYGDLVEFLKRYTCLGIIYELLVYLKFPIGVLTDDVQFQK
ncbi:PqqD family protein [Clostridium sp. FP1]|uniref:PqqD family protein n=1 Tax=Clostridium sp. FP1 TaxID=2724076 RepID=UPI0013E95D45|nr:PqqD family protein [Clostridium sp. FP1]MBZ9637474.1 PqqD family protein [Clostridium sp. FP1]